MSAAASAATVIAEGTRISGGVVARGEVIVAGIVEGSVSSELSVRLLATAEVRGDIDAPRVAIDDGALFEGQVRMRRTRREVPAPVAHTPAVAQLPSPPPTPAPPTLVAPAAVAATPPVAASPVAAPAPAPTPTGARTIPELPRLGRQKLLRRN